MKEASVVVYIPFSGPPDMPMPPHIMTMRMRTSMRMMLMDADDI